MRPFHILLVLFAIFSLVVLALMLRWERRHFIQQGKGGAWLSVRLATIPIALATAALVIIPVSSTSGLEGLAAFYFLLLVIAPVFWFGAHWIVGKFVQPALNFRESVQIAGSPIAFVIVMSLAAHTLQPIAWTILRSMGKA